MDETAHLATNLVEQVGSYWVIRTGVMGADNASHASSDQPAQLSEQLDAQTRGPETTSSPTQRSPTLSHLVPIRSRADSALGLVQGFRTECLTPRADRPIAAL